MPSYRNDLIVKLFQACCTFWHFQAPRIHVLNSSSLIKIMEHKILQNSIYISYFGMAALRKKIGTNFRPAAVKKVASDFSFHHEVHFKAS